ncbi:larval cuticle protein F1-like [Achroia grisella]|uniref:larval cuticle protein F1-like n=1 Tax=Achroia grisella TaxID=688607 RepID=UPI0027D2CC20|nr:larval cuticle protein F1-like [Achroia grisella]
MERLKTNCRRRDTTSVLGHLYGFELLVPIGHLLPTALSKRGLGPAKSHIKPAGRTEGAVLVGSSRSTQLEDMKAALCVLLLVSAVVYGAEEKKNEKRGVLGLGYGLGAPISSPLVSSGYYGHGLGLYNNGIYGNGLLGHGLYGGGLYGAGLHGVPLAAPLSAPLVSHSPYASPLLGLGHGYLH